MNKNQIICAVLLTLMTTVVKADIAIICNSSVAADSISLDAVSNIFLGKSSKLNDGSRVSPIEQEEGSEVRDQFHAGVTKKSAAQVKAYWSRLLFTGKGMPPKEVFDDDEVKELVAKDSSIIGYIDSTSLDGSVKALLIIP